MTRWDSYCYSGRGDRPKNEDAAGYQVWDGGGVWVLADGLGGHAEGDLASRTVVEAMLRGAGPECPGLREAALAANGELLELQRRRGLPRMYATLAAARQEGGRLCWLHVGDSRLYYFRDGGVLFQTEDDSVPQMLVRLGELDPREVRRSPDRNKLLHTMGEPEPRFHLSQWVETRPGDAFLLCSDGFWEPVLEVEMALDLAKCCTAREWGEYLLCRLLSRQGPQADNFTLLCGIATGEGTA